ncbi:MAG: hypothetical protein R2911_28040 [Caldilineaceae bacterium]
MSNPINRMFFGAIIALMAGISFGIYMLPQIAYALLPTLPADVSARMAPYLIYTALLWAPWGALAARRGRLRCGVLLMGWAASWRGLSIAPSAAPQAATEFHRPGGGTRHFTAPGAGALLGGGFPPMDEKGRH